jgi:GGDEF domain-containing protein
MQLTQLLLILIGIILVANIAIVAAAAARRDPGRLRSVVERVERLGRSGQQLGDSAVARLRGGRSIPSSTGSPRRPVPDPSGEDARTAAVIEAFVADIDGSAGGAIPRRIRADLDATPPMIRAAVRSDESDESDEADEPNASDESATWEGLIRDESARVRRFGRPVTVVLAQYLGLDGIAARLGPDAADRIAAEIERVLRAESRDTDRVVRLGPARFGVLMVETPEAHARAYVERARKASGQWFASAGLSPRLAVGWASPGKGEDLGVSAATAHDRMLAADPLGSPVATPS